MPFDSNPIALADESWGLMKGSIEIDSRCCQFHPDSSNVDDKIPNLYFYQGSLVGSLLCGTKHLYIMANRARVLNPSMPTCRKDL